MTADHTEHHVTHRSGWLRAMVLGANDGLVSVSSLLIGVAAANAEPRTLLTTGIAGLVAGALSMAAGEYVSVQSQADAEAADLKTEAEALRKTPAEERHELTEIYQQRGLDKSLAAAVATQLMAHDAIGAHARDELGITPELSAQPYTAALTSCASFIGGASLPLLGAVLASSNAAIAAIAGATTAGLLLLGYLGALASNAPALRSMLRVLIWGLAAMVLTGVLGSAIGAAL